MGGIIIQIIVSYLVLKYYGYTLTDALGLKPSRYRLWLFVPGLLFPIAFYCIFKFTVAWLVENPYRINPDYHIQDFIHSPAYLVRGVAFEELIFRGTLLYILMQKTGNRKAIILSSATFGIYH